MSHVRMRALVLAAIGGLAVGLARPVWAFECPEPQARDLQDVISESEQEVGEVSALLRSADLENRLEVIAQELKQKHPSANRTELTNFMVTAYCPMIASDQDLSDSAKQERLDGFSDRVWQLYSDGGQPEAATGGAASGPGQQHAPRGEHAS